MTYGGDLSMTHRPSDIARAVGTFVLHLLWSTIGVLLSSALGVYSAYSVLHEWDQWFTPKLASRTLTEVPGFPIQVAVGLLYGFRAGRTSRSPLVLWIWLVPALALLIAAAEAPHTSRPLLAHFFGTMCSPSDGCFDQVGLTLPLLASASYAAGAKIARHRAPVEADRRNDASLSSEDSV